MVDIGSTKQFAIMSNPLGGLPGQRRSYKIFIELFGWMSAFVSQAMKSELASSIYWSNL